MGSGNERVTLTITRSQAETLRFLLSCHTGPIPNYSWTRREQQQAQRILDALPPKD